MDAVVFKGVQHVEVEKRPIPSCQYATDVVVKVHIAALCGSDLHIYRGHETSETNVIMVSAK